MDRKLTFACLALVASLTLGVTAAIAGTARAGADPGVTPSSVLLGGTAPLTGPASQYVSIARGAEAYFKYLNARGGVNGRKITYKYLDDASNPAQSLPLTRQLVEQDKVFAVFNSLGTAQNLAVRPYLNGIKVPQLFVASGATTWGRDHAQYPYSIGLQPNYQAEGWVYGRYLARTAPGATIAVLFQNDDFGKDLLGGLRRGLQRSNAKVIAAQPYEANALDVSSQIAKLMSSEADTLVIFAAPSSAIQAYQYANKLGWRPKRVITNADASSSWAMQTASADGQNKLVNGTVSIVFLKDPTDPQWRNDAAMRLYRKILTQYAPGADVDDPLHVYGMAAAWTAAAALKKAGKDLTRASLLQVLDTFNATGNPFMIPGIAVKTSGRDHYPVEQMLLQRWQKGTWNSFGGLWGYRAT